MAGIILNSIWKDEVRAINAEELSMWILQQINLGKLKFKDLDKKFSYRIFWKSQKVNRKKKIRLEDLDEELQENLQTQWNLNQRGNIMCQNAGNCAGFLGVS